MRKFPKLIIIFSPYYPPHTGGLENHASEFVYSLVKNTKNTRVIIFTSKVPPSLLDTEESFDRIRIFRFPAFELIPNFPLPKFWDFRFWRMYSKLFHLKADLIISRTRFFSTSLLALFLSKITKTKWVHIEHGSDFVKLGNFFYSGLARIYDLTVGRLIFNLSDLNISISKAVQNFIRRYDSRNSPVIYRGIRGEEIEQIPPDYSIRKRFPNKKIICYAGRLIEGKGVADLIKAVSFLRGQKTVTLIIGDGPERERLKELSKTLKLEGKVYLLGEKTHRETIAIIKCADLFVNPSYTEGLPTSVLEAGYCGCPIIATDVGGTQEIIRDRRMGILVPPRNIKALTKAIEEILILPERDLKKMGLNVHRFIKNNFVWEAAIRKYLDLFKTL